MEIPLKTRMENSEIPILGTMFRPSSKKWMVLGSWFSHMATRGKKMVTWTSDWVLNWHLTEETLTEMKGRAYLTAKQTYRAKMKTFEVRGPK